MGFEALWRQEWRRLADAPPDEARRWLLLGAATGASEHVQIGWEHLLAETRQAAALIGRLDDPRDALAAATTAAVLADPALVTAWGAALRRGPRPPAPHQRSAQRTPETS